MRMETISKCPLCDIPSNESTVIRQSADIVRCDQVPCNLVYLRTRPLDCELWKLYQKYADEESHMRLPKSVSEHNTTGLRRENFLTFALPSQPPEFPVVADIGCGWGAMLYAIWLRWKQADLQGFEICQKAADYCNTKIAPCGFSGQFWQHFNAYGQFDLVTMCHVLEHMVDLRKSLDTIAQMLKVGGTFAGIVPNFAGRGSTTYGDRWYWLDANFHYLHFEERSLRTALTQFGFTDIVTETHRGDFEPCRLKEAHESVVGHELTDPEVDELIDTDDKAGRGEELWFKCRKS